VEVNEYKKKQGLASNILIKITCNHCITDTYNLKLLPEGY